MSDTLQGKRVTLHRRRTWRERLLSWPWRPWAAWEARTTHVWQGTGAVRVMAVATGERTLDEMRQAARVAAHNARGPDHA